MLGTVEITSHYALLVLGIWYSVVKVLVAFCRSFSARLTSRCIIGLSLALLAHSAPAAEKWFSERKIRAHWSWFYCITADPSCDFSKKSSIQYFKKWHLDQAGQPWLATSWEGIIWQNWFSLWPDDALSATKPVWKSHQTWVNWDLTFQSNNRCQNNEITVIFKVMVNALLSNYEMVI